jgi:hypothetical protein
MAANRGCYKMSQSDCGSDRFDGLCIRSQSLRYHLS